MSRIFSIGLIGDVTEPCAVGCVRDTFPPKHRCCVFCFILPWSLSFEQCFCARSTSFVPTQVHAHIYTLLEKHEQYVASNDIHDQTFACVCRCCCFFFFLWGGNIPRDRCFLCLVDTRNGWDGMSTAVCCILCGGGSRR